MPGHTRVNLLMESLKAVKDKQWGTAVELYTQILAETDGEEDACADAVPKDCSKPMILFSRATAYLKMGDFMRSVKDAESALENDPSYVDGYRILSSAYFNMKLLGHAEVALKKGLKLDMGNEPLLKILSEIRQNENVHAPVYVKDGSDQRLRKFQQRTGLEMDANTFPDVVRAIMVGDIHTVQQLWKREEHLNLKMTRLLNPLIHFPVIGRQRITPKVPVEEYCQVIDFLFDQGCRLDHRDGVGYTAIMHACGPEPEHGIIQYMLEKGADPNIQSSYGTTALHDAVQSQHEDIVDTLLQHGADPHLPDNNGTTPYQSARFFHRLLAIFDKHLSPNSVEKSCTHCSSRVGINRCTKCRYVFYCSKECQVEHWPSHKKQCKKITKSHLRLKIIPQNELDHEMYSLISNFSETLQSNLNNPPRRGKKPLKPSVKTYERENLENFNKAWSRGGNILKVQVSGVNQQILAYNKNKELVLFLSSSEMDGERMVEVVHEKGFKGHVGDVECGKGYFLGFSDAPGEIVLITDPMLPAQPW